MNDHQLPVKVDYEVGYGKPPVQHRFAKGTSGNPGGRPKKPKASRVSTEFGMKPTEEYLRLEAYRPVTIREGDRIIELPAIQAVFRAMGVSALKGNRFAQKTMAEIVTRMEEEHHRSKFDLMGKAMDYKIAWEREIERCRAAGMPDPAPIPHPDDMIINPDTGAVEIKGPKTKEQKERLDEALQRRAEAQEEVSFFAQKYRRTRDPKRKAQYLEDWHWEQRMFDIINDIVPQRYKTKLQDRSWAPGASREGKALDELRANRKLREDYVG